MYKMLKTAFATFPDIFRNVILSLFTISEYPMIYINSRNYQSKWSLMMTCAFSGAFIALQTDHVTHSSVCMQL